MQSITSFQASILIGNKKIELDVKKGQNIKDYAHHLTEQYTLPPYLTISLYSVLLSAMAKTSQKEVLHQLKTCTLNRTEKKKLFLEAYQTNTLEYYNKPEEVKKKTVVVYELYSFVYLGYISSCLSYIDSLSNTKYLWYFIRIRTKLYISHSWTIFWKGSRTCYHQSKVIS